MKIAITGHRPNKLGNDYNLTSPLLLGIKKEIVHVLDHYFRGGKDVTFITGMALGIDTLFALIAVEKNIPFIAAVPCWDQDIKWPNKSRSLYHELIKKAQLIVNVHEGYYNDKCMQNRNEWMVDHCDHLIAVWDETPGGTANCVKYAKNRKPILYINPKTINV